MEGDVPAMMAAVLQTVAAKLLRSAGDAAASGQAGRIEPQHIWQAFERDEELKMMQAAGLAPEKEEEAEGAKAEAVSG